MNAVPHFRPNCCCTYRWSGRAAAAILVALWATLVAVEGLPVNGFPLTLAQQGVVLAVVFAGYAISLRHELAGAVVSMIALVAFFGLSYYKLNVLPGMAMALFAVPPMLFAISWRLAKKDGHVQADEPAATDHGIPTPQA